jgi:formate hydrogenlyase subunit 4
MTGSTVLIGVVMLGAVVIAPLLPGLIQRQKALFQGRPGASIAQPYRDLRRLWRKRVVDVAGAGIAYVVAPAVSAAALLAVLLVVPLAGSAPDFGLGHDALVVVGLLALARCAIAVSAWDTTSGFGLMAAGRELTLAVAGEFLLALVVLTAALPAGGTDLTAMWREASGTGIWAHPAHWCGLLGMLVVVLVETGRQPIDNPDTHLELTMIHEGPLLEYAGRDLAYLQWSVAARHWAVLALTAGLFLPHPAGAVAGVAVVLAWMLVLTTALAVVETTVAKMRLLRVPHLVGGVGVVTLVGVITWIFGIAA